MTQTSTPNSTKIYALADDWAISYMEYGNKDGFPVLYFHGFPGSHEDIELFRGVEIADRLEIRLIAVNRPGYVDSQSKPGRNLLDWSDDIKELADHLALDSFSILGYSGGGPFALACAYAMPERIIHAGVVSGMGPWDAPESKKGMARMLEKKPEKIQANMTKKMPEVDKAAVQNPIVNEAFMNTLKLALSNGGEGAFQDAKIFKGDRGFDLSQIEASIILWHGGEDQNVRVKTAMYVAGQIPGCEREIMNNEGHISLLFNYAEDILGILAR